MEDTDVFDQRRQALAALVSNIGRGAIAEIGGRTGMSPSYISRLISDPTTKQHRKITGETVLLLDAHYPGWIDAKPGDEPIRQALRIESPKDRCYEDAAQTTSRIIALADKLNDDGLQLLLAFAETLTKVSGNKRRENKSSSLPIRRDDNLSGLGKIRRKKATGTGRP